MDRGKPQADDEKLTKKDLNRSEIVEKAKRGFAEDLLDPRFDSLYADNDHLAKLVASCNLIDGKKYLDIGTGSGYVAFALAERNPEIFVTGIDIVEGAIDLITQRANDAGLGSRLNFICYKGRDLPFDTGSFYGITSRYAFHHFPDPNYFIHDIHRILEENGFCLISDPSPNEEDRVDFGNRHAALKDDGHVRYYRENEMIDLFKNAGMEMDKKFYSEVTFARDWGPSYEKLLHETPSEILRSYNVKIQGLEVYATLKILNILFRK